MVSTTAPTRLGNILAEPPRPARRAIALPPETGRSSHVLTTGQSVFQADIPDRYRRWRLEDYRPATVRAVRAWLADASAWSLLIHGAPGTWKSSLAAATVTACRAGGVRSMFAAPESARSRLREFAEWWTTQAHEVAVLALDDLGAGRDTPFVHEAVCSILRHRYDRGAKTILTANVDAGGLATWDPRIADRLREGVVLFAGGESRRGPTANGARPR